MNNSFKYAIDKYLRSCKIGNWVKEEAYKFEFANYIYQNVDWKSNTDQEILTILKGSQRIKYTDSTGIQFILKSGRKKLSEFISLKDVELLRRVQFLEVSQIDWSERTMSYPALSAWIASLFPNKFYPVPMTEFDQTINYLFGLFNEPLPIQGERYIIDSQPYMQKTWENLNLYPIENLYLLEWNKYYEGHPELKISKKTELSQVDKVWLTQDFHLFVHREILHLYKKKNKTYIVQEISEPTVVEGNSVLAEHLRYERNASFIHKIKERALARNKMLNCQVCEFSFLEKYGEIGEGFIEAHHKKPLSEIKQQTLKTEDDIVLVCSNCHRMLHRDNLAIDVEKLKLLVKKD